MYDSGFAWGVFKKQGCKFVALTQLSKLTWRESVLNMRCTDITELSIKLRRHVACMRSAIKTMNKNRIFLHKKILVSKVIYRPCISTRCTIRHFQTQLFASVRKFTTLHCLKCTSNMAVLTTVCMSLRELNIASASWASDIRVSVYLSKTLAARCDICSHVYRQAANADKKLNLITLFIGLELLLVPIVD